ncbi:hypothetical protein [Metallosphaera hakonensis]|uniref:Uncharacterized protein n=1 Tax=Metallosphaera hakonensis JCM 8857 = DSM 7519 TaxID=1293036 RepID=A0A2U9IUU5_9CREN|nr:hypothetical protein [Metallosphaera hakonensis]AWR99860.1 hypothetical protein DFR87_09335 [Metallosphaera hakonensis JCM 8857 = DSM 7519]
MLSDDDSIEQLIIRKKLFESVSNKPVKLYLVCNSIPWRIKRKAEKGGVTVISGYILGKGGKPAQQGQPVRHASLSRVMIAAREGKLNP